MRPEKKSQLLLGVTRSKAKMLEYGVPEEHHITITQDPAKLFTISIGLLGDLAAAINREGPYPESLADLKANLLFSARFFDSYLQSKLNETLEPYLVLLGSASYYLCDLPGSALVLAKHIDGDCPDLDGDVLEDLLLWLLQADLGTYFDGAEGPFGGFIDGISKWILQFFEDGNGEENLLDLATKLRNAVYEFGTPRQLLFGDVIAAVLRKKLENSAWKALPSYSGLPRDKWLHALQKDSFIKELWPAQHLLGQADVLKGESAVVQMPTSAGKTKATELILRSAFLAERVSLAIIIAPFRALCHEIKNSLVEAFHDEPTKVDELSDVLQADFEITELLGHQQILVITPEKLLYALRHAPEMAAHVGLLVFDEGHQFDSGTRGITYELLLTSLRSMIPKRTQKVLISAVISNAEAVGEWLNGAPNVVEGTTLIPTFRSVGFASWLDQLGRIEYVDSRDTEQGEFFVPRVIERFNLGRKKRERTDRFFPDKTDGQAIALYLGLKLVPNGGIAIFCGRKSTAANVCEKAVDIIERGTPLTLPSDFSDAQEVERLTHLHVENLGTDAPASQSAAHGIFSHHGNTPHGIRLAVEHAMRDNLVRFVVCTSTLAQGVNLPIRYLIVTSVYQGIERIKVRDFHNLIGRAGRAGMHTEGSILFADPAIYDGRKARNDKWRWGQVKELLEPRNSEPCISNLLSIFDPIKSGDEKYTITMKALDFAKAYINDPDEVAKMAAKIATQHGEKGFSREGVERQIAWRISLICAVESFLLSHWDQSEGGLSEADVTRLSEETLAFFLADEQKKEHIRELFQLLAGNISATITDPARRRIYGRTLYGIQEAQAIERWVQSNADNLLSIGDETEALNLVWPLLTRHINGGVFTKFDKPEVLKEIAYGWISGKPFSDLLETIHKREAKMIWGTKRREFKIDHVVDVCEGTLAYDGALVVGAVCEFIETLDQDGTGELINRLQLFQKRLKYGLPTETTIVLYELGFSDRVISQDFAASLNLAATQKKYLVKALKQDRDGANAVMEKYPSYFQNRMNELLS
ncbi:DEAD/DEAH box helicase [Limnobaculum xujianqingii]|uniref:DEAD/DEAH box helicase n=1 Tax=Limnobaculum xujianqingii TaxID=2738837 RepID=UPI00112DFF02|nr:DEAD/DEAH box helicase [Limnobaculum xujianqingii]